MLYWLMNIDFAGGGIPLTTGDIYRPFYLSIESITLLPENP